jgi:hypothetical protein
VNKLSTERTAEQAYQEDLLEHAYRTSGNPVFEARADVMMATFVAEVGEQVEPVRDFWKPNPDAGLDEEDPRSALAYQAYADAGVRLGVENGRIVPIDLKPHKPVDPSQPTH